ncbi:MAG: tetratricopeptide repeat protein [Polyangiaceae bacterium]|nr:tetratricopeptide repeat protein [Polyangiaceae bacterium]
MDAIRRRAPLYWLAAIVLIRPLGGVAYFFFVKIRDYRTRTGALHGEPTSRWWHGAWRLGGAATLDPAELAAADALEVAGRYADAIPLYQAVLARTPRHLQALHGLGRCMLGVGNPGRAVQLLGEVLSEDTSFGNYSAALEYAEALWQAGQHQDCLRVLERMVGATGRINHRIALAHYAMLSELPSRAREVLEQALAAHASAPDTVRRRQQQWANRATHMLASLRVV